MCHDEVAADYDDYGNVRTRLRTGPQVARRGAMTVAFSVPASLLLSVHYRLYSVNLSSQ